MNVIRINHKTLWIFLFCATIVILIQFFLLKPILDFSLFSEDDWKWLLLFRSVPDSNILSKFALIWTKTGIHGGGYAIYMGIMGEILGNNYWIYQYLNVIFKIISTLTFFPLILILFKNRSLALLTTIIFAISSASTGSFYWYMKGGVFIGITFMNLFFIAYYYALIKKTKMLLLCSSILIFLAYLSSPTRIYPVFLIIVFIEVYRLLDKKSLASLKQSIARLACFLLPSLIIALQAPISPYGSPQKVPVILFNEFIHGNWYNFLSPFAAMGYSLLTNGAWKYFGVLDYSTFTTLNNYMLFLFSRTIWIFSFFLIFLSIILSKNPIRFFTTVFCLNFLLDILMFFIVNYYLTLPPAFFTILDPSLFNITKYPTLVAIFITVVAFSTFMEWLKDKKNYLLIPVFIGPLFSLVFLIPMWLSLGFLLDGYSSTQYYYQIPAMGMSLYLSAFLVLALKRFKKKILNILISIFIIVVIVKFYQASSIEINHEFLPIYPERVKLTDQQVLHEKLIAKLGNLDEEGNILVYFEIPNDYFIFNYYKRSLLLDSNSFASMINWRKYPNIPRCLGNISSIDILKSAYVFKNDRWGFLLNGRCASELFKGLEDQDKLHEEQNVFYSIDSLKAYKVVGGELIDIKESLLKELQLSKT